MAKEIERKFLVAPRFVDTLTNGVYISQGYINTQGHTAVRVRIKGEQAFLTIKGESNGFTRSEFEYEIPTADARDMIAELCDEQTVNKTRHEITHGEHLWELDVFHDQNTGLVLAEVELMSESEPVEIPSWVTAEVTGQVQYFNSYLIANPFRSWTSQQ